MVNIDLCAWNHVWLAIQICLRQRKWLGHFPHNNHFQYLNTCAYLSEVGNSLLAYVPAGLVNMKYRNILYLSPSLSLSVKFPISNSVCQYFSFTILIFHFVACFKYSCDSEFWLWQHCGAPNTTVQPSHLWHSLTRVLSVSKCSNDSYPSEILYSDARANDLESPCYKTQLNNCIVCRARSETVTHNHTSVFGNSVCVSDRHLVCPKKQYTMGMTVTQREWEAQFSVSLCHVLLVCHLISYSWS